MSNFLTLHILQAVPYSCLNRDDTGTPKRQFEGGVMRALLSSQSIKRGIRKRYELGSMSLSLEDASDASIRSKNLHEYVAEAAHKANPSLSLEDARKASKKFFSQLVKKAADKKDSEAGGDADLKNSQWFSVEELDTLAASIAGSASDGDINVLEEGKTGSLAIAAFGRMFAMQPQYNVEAAVAVSPAVTTHAAVIDTDYFTTADDYSYGDQGAGASYLDVAQYTSGLFYRSITIDREQLKKSWTGMSSGAAADQLKLMVDAMVFGMPSGKTNSTAPFTMPEVVIAEEQRHRVAYHFETPVKAHAKDGGFAQPSVSELHRQFDAARKFDSSNFGPVEVVSGVSPLLDEFEAPRVGKDELIEKVVAWILQ